MNNPIIDKYFRMDNLPHIWCPGCGHGIIMMSIQNGYAKIYGYIVQSMNGTALLKFSKI